MDKLKPELEKCLEGLEEDRQIILRKLYKEIADNIPKGFAPTVQYKMISFVIPKDLYPKGYHVDPKHPLPYVSIASQKNYISVYHLGIYAKKELMDWLVGELEKAKVKVDIGKSCIRFNPKNDIPYKLIGKLCGNITAEEYIRTYESNLEESKKNRK
jgi:uncharacterized protein YdhG (YjbR/CyaY superfamily)